MRFYGFVAAGNPGRRSDGMLDLAIDPKLAWALRNARPVSGRRQPRRSRKRCCACRGSARRRSTNPGDAPPSAAAAGGCRPPLPVDRQGAAVHRRRRLVARRAHRQSGPARTMIAQRLRTTVAVLIMQPAQLESRYSHVRLASETDFRRLAQRRATLRCNGVQTRRRRLAGRTRSGSARQCGCPPFPPVPGSTFHARSSSMPKRRFCHSDPEPVRFSLPAALAAAHRAQAAGDRIGSRHQASRGHGEERCAATSTRCAPSCASGRSGDGGAGALCRLVRARSHFIVERNAAFFVRRFTGMRWSILTPHASRRLGRRKAGDRTRRRQGRCAGRRTMPRSLWRTYFAEHLQSGAAEGEGDAGGDAEEILAQPSRGRAHSGPDRRSGQGRAKT